MAKRWWISWYHKLMYPAFTLTAPWWESGYVPAMGDTAICAIIHAGTEDGAKRIVEGAYEFPVANVDFRFCTEQEEGWWPPEDRFPRAEWMQDT